MVHFALDSNMTVELFHDALHYGESEAVAHRMICAQRAGNEKLRLLSLLQTCPIVFDPKPDEAIVR